MVVKFTGGMARWKGVYPRGRSNFAAERDEELVHGCQLLWSTDVEGDGSGIEDGSMTVPTTSATMGLVRGNVV